MDSSTITAARRCSSATSRGQIAMRKGTRQNSTACLVPRRNSQDLWSQYSRCRSLLIVTVRKSLAPRASSVAPERTSPAKEPAVHLQPAQADERPQLSYYRSFYDSFAEHLERSSDSVWGPGQGPFSGVKDDLKLRLSPEGMGPEAQALLQGHAGGAVAILMLASCFPKSQETLQALTDEMAGILIDDWLEEQTPSVVAEHASWWASLVERWEETRQYDYKWARQMWPASYDANPTLSKKYAELLCSSMSVLHKVSKEAEPRWFGHFLRESEMWAKSVYFETKLKSFLRPGTTKETPKLHEYMSYRGLCTGATSMFMLAALSQGIRLSDKRVEEALPFIDVGGMVIGAFNDCLSPRKDAQAGVPNLANMKGLARAVDIHNMLVDLFEEEGALWLEGAEVGDQSLEFVDLIKASLFGTEFYQLVAPRYTRKGQIEQVDIVDGQVGRFTSKESALKEQIRSFVHNRPDSAIQSLRSVRGMP